MNQLFLTKYGNKGPVRERARHAVACETYFGDVILRIVRKIETAPERLTVIDTRASRVFFALLREYETGIIAKYQ